jgi:hypothetical protein
MTASVLPKPVRTFRDASTGATVHQITDGPTPTAHAYFTRSSWACGGKYMVLYAVDERGAQNVVRYDADGTRVPLTQLAPPFEPFESAPHMHHRFLSWELDRLQMRIPAQHPTLPLMVYPWQNELRLVDIEKATDELLHYIPRDEGEMPLTATHVCFTADGRDLIFSTNRRKRPGEPRIDPPGVTWHSFLRDESWVRGKLWRYDFAARKLVGCIYEFDGEASHVLACPWDAELLVWTNYLHEALESIHRDGSHHRVIDRGLHGHYNWDVAGRRLLTLRSSTSDDDRKWWTHHGLLDLTTGKLAELQSLAGKYQWHQNVSPDGRWIVTDAPAGLIDGKPALHLIDIERDRAVPLCVTDASWTCADPQGRKVKSEFLHVNPSFSPCGKYVAFATDFARGVSAVQTYVVEVPPHHV